MSYKLTAERVREAIERNGTETLGCRWQFRESDWQAIADELNAMLGDVEKLESDYVELCELVREMWTFTQVMRAQWDACEFESRMRKLGVVE